eukprot:5522895-Prymnesium_polylepis.1
MLTGDAIAECRFSRSLALGCMRTRAVLRGPVSAGGRAKRAKRSCPGAYRMASRTRPDAPRVSDE